MQFSDMSPEDLNFWMQHIKIVRTGIEERKALTEGDKIIKVMFAIVSILCILLYANLS